MTTILSSFISCSTIHLSSLLIPSKVKHHSNLITCILYQIYFVYQSLQLVIKSQTELETSWQIISQETLQNLDTLVGYFLYDILYLLSYDKNIGFILHHLIGISMIYFINSFGAPKHLLFYYNIFCFIAEASNPFLNFRHFVKDTSYYSSYIKFISISYFIFRILLFPYYGYKVSILLQVKPLNYFFSIIYMMSVIWFRKLVGMVRRLQ